MALTCDVSSRNPICPSQAQLTIEVLDCMVTGHCGCLFLSRRPWTLIYLLLIHLTDQDGLGKPMGVWRFQDVSTERAVALTRIARIWYCCIPEPDPFCAHLLQATSYNNPKSMRAKEPKSASILDHPKRTTSGQLSHVWPDFQMRHVDQ